MMIEQRPYLLENSIQFYPWGTRDEQALIPRLLGISAEPGKPYAELWMGAHPTAPSQVRLNGDPIPLDRFIAHAPEEILGPTVTARFGKRLPFLCKVLSAREALSIQTHPNKRQAARLHAADPHHYPDANHKPEVAIALDSLTALVGFRPFPELRQTLLDYPEIADFVGAAAYPLLAGDLDSADAARESLRRLYTTLVTRALDDAPGLQRAIRQLEQRLRRQPHALTEIEQRFLTLRRTYRGADVGLFSIFLLNLVHLRSGEGLFTGAGVPHAYLEGNIVECMANSDNVIRAGLTHKFKDVAQLVEVLAYEAGPAHILGRDAATALIVYETPTDEFQVSRRRLEPGEAVAHTIAGPELYLVTQGGVTLRWSKGEPLALRRGQSALIPASLREVRVSATEGSELFRVVVPAQPSSA